MIAMTLNTTPSTMSDADAENIFSSLYITGEFRSVVVLLFIMFIGGHTPVQKNEKGLFIMMNFLLQSTPHPSQLKFEYLENSDNI